jgi:hypothetical protein
MFIEHEEETGRKTIELKSINKSNKTMQICTPPGTILLERFLIHAIRSTLIGFKEVAHLLRRSKEVGNTNEE